MREKESAKWAKLVFVTVIAQFDSLAMVTRLQETSDNTSLTL